jgi:hypothetical protein
MNKNKVYLIILSLFTALVFSCSKGGGDGGKSSKVCLNSNSNTPTSCGIMSNGASSMLGYDSLTNLADIVKKDGAIPLYSSFGNRSGLMSAGDGNFCLILVNGDLKCWGRNDHYQLGNGNINDLYTPTLASELIKPGNKIISVFMGEYNTCVYYQNNEIKCVGDKRNFKLDPTDDQDDAITSTDINKYINNRKIKDIKFGWQHVCYLDNNNDVYCWGNNYIGQVGSPTLLISKVQTATKVNFNGAKVEYLATQNRSTCVILKDSKKVFCWGNAYGIPPETYSSTPVEITGFADKPVSIGSGTDINDEYCVVLENKTAQCFKGITTLTNLPVTVTKDDGSLLQNVNIAIASDVAKDADSYGWSLCAVANDFDDVYCLGRSYILGNNSVIDSKKAVKVDKSWDPKAKIVDFVFNDSVACVLLNNNEVWCWGKATDWSDAYLGHVTLRESNVPIKITSRNP